MFLNYGSMSGRVKQMVRRKRPRDFNQAAKLVIDPKLLCTFLVGDRTTPTAIDFVDDLKQRLANRVQVTSDGHGAYLRAMDEVFGDDADYARIRAPLQPHQVPWRAARCDHRQS
jgi:hypothetical protein